MLSYHPEVNPIEKIWALVKTWVAARNVDFKIATVEQLTRQRFGEITAQDWGKICDHVDKIVNEYMQKEHIFDAISDELCFVVNTSDLDEDEEFSSVEIDGIEPLL